MTQDQKDAIGMSILLGALVLALIIPGAGMLLFPLVIFIPFAFFL